MKKITALILLVCMSVTLFSGCIRFDGGEPKLTVMMYVVGSDLESENGCASSDIDEILNSGLDLNNINFLIYTGGAKGWKTDIPNSINTVYQVAENDGVKELVQVFQTESRKNMGESAQLTEFLNYAYDNYPARKFGLICWDHGGGPNQGFGYDENYDDLLELGELSAAFEASPFKGDNKLSFIGFDACLMGSLEVGNALRDYADCLIASEETEPGYGWDYSFLSDVGWDCSAEIFAKACIDRFYADKPGSVLESMGSQLDLSPQVHSPITLSCVDLNKLEPLNKAVDALFGAMDSSVQSSGILPLVYQRQSLYAFGEGVTAEGGTEPDLVDIGELAEVCRTDHPAEAEAVASALSDYVMYQQSNVGQASGATIYYPFSGLYTFYYQGGREACQSFSEAPGYVRYIKSFTDQCFRGVTASEDGLERNDSALTNADTSERTVSVKMTEEQKSTFSAAYVNVLLKRSSTQGEDIYNNNDYYPLLLDYRITPDDEGVLSFDADIAVPVTGSDSEKNFVPMRQVSSVMGRSTYKSLGTLLISTPEVFPDTAWETVRIFAALSDISDELRITGIHYTDKTGHHMGKNDVDPSDWNYCASWLQSKMLKYNDDGTLPPYSEWENRTNYLMYYYPFDRDMSLKMLPLSKCNYGEYCYQLVIEDIYGNRQSSGLFSFMEGEHYHNETEKTENGSLTYRIFSDRAELEKYEGTDSKLTIPAEYGGVPVSVIRENAFKNVSGVEEIVVENPDTYFGAYVFNSSTVKKITLPEGMKTISEKAFAGCQAEEIIIPSTVETVGRHAFMRCTSLRELKLPAGLKKIGIGAFSGTIPENGVSFEGENENYKISDGFLLSKNGKIAYSCFQEGESCVVPEGVTEIASWCCIGASVKRYNGQQETQNVSCWVKSVSLPSTLKYIRSDAFRNCILSELEIPDSVEYIGHNAFANYENKPTGSPSDNDLVRPTVKIGKGLRLVGKEVFGYVVPADITVSEENAWFSVKDGKLMNKAGDYEIPLSKEVNNDAAREGEYKAMEAVRDKIDLSDYEPSGLREEYFYEGSSYYKELELKQTSKKLEPSVYLGLVSVTLPCGLSDLLDMDFEPHNPEDCNVILKPGKTYSLELKNSQGKTLKVRCSNNTEGDIPVTGATVIAVTVPNDNGVGFLSNGVSNTMDISRVAEKLGKPNEVTVNYKSSIELTVVTLSYRASVPREKGKGSMFVTLDLCYAYDTETGMLTAYENSLSAD